MNFIELYAGIGGFRYGIEQEIKDRQIIPEPRQFCPPNKYSESYNRPINKQAGYTCVWSNEWDKYAASIYRYHYGEICEQDIRTVDVDTIPEHDLICAGFPCQSFSIAGERKGFDDIRGTLFFEICRIARVKRTPYLWLENVKGLLNHNKGITYETILRTLDELGYDCQWQVLNSKNFGVPQNRERVFIIGQRRDTRHFNIFPIKSYYEYKDELSKERVYLLSPDISENIRILLFSLSQSQKKEVSRQQMQGLLTQISEGISKESCREIQSDSESLDSNTEGSLQIVEELNSWAFSIDNSREVYGVVQIPTEEVLLLWSTGESTSISFRCVQQQDLSFECGQNRLIEAIRGWKSCSLLLAVQPYKGRLFYSVGNGRDWQKIYCSEVDSKCKITLNSILEDNPDQKYFLSGKMLQGIQNRMEANPNMGWQYQVVTQKCVDKEL
jgi:DNA-cytosine methyltransferase